MQVRCLTPLLLSGADMEDRETEDNTPVHVVNIEIKDNHESATIGAMHILKLAGMVRGRRGTEGKMLAVLMILHSPHQLEEAEDLDNDIQSILEEFESKTNESILHATAFY